MSAKLGTCADCEHWNMTNGARGQCRNRSPAIDPHAIVGHHNGPIYGPKTYWPETASYEWCGDHLSKLDDTHT